MSETLVAAELEYEINKYLEHARIKSIDKLSTHKYNIDEYVKYFNNRSKKTIGKITKSKIIYVKNRESYNVLIDIKYKDYNNELIKLTIEDGFHWPDEEDLTKFKQKMKKGSKVIVFYDPEITEKSNIYFID